MARRRTPPRGQQPLSRRRSCAGWKPGPTATSTKCARSPRPGPSRPIAVPVAITKSVPALRMWWYGQLIHAGRSRGSAALAHAVLDQPRDSRSYPKVVLSWLRSGSRLDQLDQHPAGVLGVDEVDPRVRRAAPGRFVDQPHALRAQSLAEGVQIADPDRPAAGCPVRACPRTSRSPTTRRAGPSTGSAPCVRARHREHRLADALVVVDFLMHQDHAEVVVVPLDRGVQVGDRDADVIESPSPKRWPGRDGRQLDRSSSHNGNLTVKIALLRVGRTGRPRTPSGGSS